MLRNEVNAFRRSFTCFLDVTHTPKKDDLFSDPLTFELRGTPTTKPEQRATRDETHGLEMPRQGVSLLNDMLGLKFLGAMNNANTPKKTPLQALCT